MSELAGYGGHQVIKMRSDTAAWSRITIETVHKARLASPRRVSYLTAKRWMDVLCAVVLLAVLFPLMVLIALAIKLDSSGPAIFRQKRVGRLGREFVMFKFRSMFAHADQAVHRQFAKQYINGHNGGQAVYKLNGDGRITRVGKWLRRTSLDELPQLFNVLSGEMSLVGPRPAVDYEVEQYSQWQLKRLAVVPGLTGLAQISGRSGLTFEKIARVDIEYIERRSLVLDVWIMLQTIPVVLKAKCAA